MEGRLRGCAEEWIYDLNQREHWIFRIYDRGNEMWAALRFRGVRRRASEVDVAFESHDGTRARIRFLAPDDLDRFAQLLALFNMPYRPPHGLDRASAHSALGRCSYLPFGIFDGDALVGYVLLRLFFWRRVVTGVWSLETHRGRGLNVVAAELTGKFLRDERLPDYATVPLDNTQSLRAALVAGWKIARRNRRFYVILR